MVDHEPLRNSGEIHVRRAIVVTVPTPPTFASRLDERSLAALRRIGRQRRFDRGASLTREGVVHDHVVLIEDGWATLSVAADDDTEMVIGVRGPGDLLGELAVIDGPGTGRAATITARSDLRALVVPGADFLGLVDTDSSLRTALLRDLSQRLRQSGTRLAQQATSTVEQHLARLVLELAERAGQSTADGLVLDLGLTQYDLAGLVGASRDAVAKALASLRRAGLVRTSRRTLVVVDAAALAARGADG